MDYVPLAEAACAVGVSRDTIYRTAVTLERLSARRIVSRQNGRLRSRWMVNLAEVRAYFEQCRIVQDNPVKPV